MFAGNWNGDVALGVTFSSKDVVLMAGPCTLESLELGLKVGSFLKDLCAKNQIPYIFKSSFDKANRTKDSSPRGPGRTQGLEWLKQIRQELQVPVLTDIHTIEDVEAAADVCDVLQMPAFLCEHRELLISAALSKKVIQIKKGQFVSPQYMVEVAQYMEKCGNSKVILCERGTCFGYRSLIVDYTNIYEMKRYGNCVSFDATHSAQQPGNQNGQTGGQREIIPTLARAALASHVNGLFLEVHPEPAKAWSDAATQLSFLEAQDIISSLRQYGSSSIGLSK